MAAIDQVWLRCAVVIACAIGIAMVAIGVATYLMAVDSSVAAWVFFVLAGLVTLAMPAVRGSTCGLAVELHRFPDRYRVVILESMAESNPPIDHENCCIPTCSAIPASRGNDLE